MGTYADTLLTSGESVLLRQRQHWLALLLDSRVALALWVIAGALLLILLVFNVSGTAGQVLGYLVLITVAAGLVVLAYRWWKWRTEEYLVTTRRLLKVSGIINKRSADSSLEKINDAILEENLIGRMLGYGDLDILTAADVAIDRYRMLNRAKDFKKRMLAAKHALETGEEYREVRAAPPPQRMAPPPAAVPPAPAPAAAPVGTAPVSVPPSAPPPTRVVDRADTPDEVASTLANLAQLRDSGAISATEYEAKKQELLGRL
jgi:hypothetical protein